MVNMNDLLSQLRSTGLVVVIRTPEAGHAENIGRTLIANGVTVLEVALTCPDALDAIRALRADLPEGVRLGAGTVMTPQDVTAAHEAGAEFMVTPSLCPSIEASVAAGIPIVVGALTPSEVYAAHVAGATAVKVFPVRSAGGAPHIKALSEPFPQIPLIAVGGVALDSIADFRAAGAIGVGAGGPLVGDAARGGSLDELAARTVDYVRVCAGL